MMEAPNIVSTLKIEELNFTFCVGAYRKLTKTELQNNLQIWLNHSRYKKIPKNKTVEVISILGYDS